jgi:hypothetical protein
VVPPAGGSTVASAAAATPVQPVPAPPPAVGRSTDPAGAGTASGSDARQGDPLHLLPYGMLGVLLALPIGWWAYRRRGQADLRKRLRTASSDFRDSKDGRGLKPKRIEISNAAVEVARAVETLRPTVAMVRLGDVTASPQPSVQPLSASEMREQIALKLEIARACIEVGRALVARSLLAAVQQEGEEDERAAAAELMLKLA